VSKLLPEESDERLLVAAMAHIAETFYMVLASKAGCSALT
jgi:hypothetical protein